MKIETILTTKGSNVVTVRPDQSVKEAIDLLNTHRIGALVVVDEVNQPVGIISERDIVRQLAHSDTLLTQAVSHVMTKNLITASSYDDLSSVGQMMINKRFRHVPVVDEGLLVGIVSIGDVLKTQLEAYQGEVDTLQTRIIEEQAGGD